MFKLKHMRSDMHACADIAPLPKELILHALDGGLEFIHACAQARARSFKGRYTRRETRSR